MIFSMNFSNDFITQKVYFSWLMRVCVGLMLVALLCLVQVSLLFIDQHGLGHFFGYRPLLPIGWIIVQILRQRRRKAINTAPTTLSAIQPTSQSTFVNTLLISRNDKNKQIPVTLLSQHKLPLTGRNI
jgi:hypothetical protein